jgi:CheY-like chemotaxis protein/anti-sigma regulatory factor (Ser/Thr protein kinase)
MTGAGGRVLLVDDTPSKRYVLSSWLRRGGFEVVEASTGAEALQIFRAGGIALVVLDVRLPDRTGYEVCEEMKADLRYGTTPVIHVSAAATESVDRTQGLERGADAYLIEPIDPDELLATIASVLRYYQARLHAEKLAARLANLARISVAMGAAGTQQELLQVAGSGAATIFDSPAALIATRNDGVQYVALSTGPGQPVEVRPWQSEVPEPPVGITVRDQAADGWPPSLWPAEATLRVLAVRPRPDRPPLHVLVPTESIVDGMPVLTLFGQAVMSAMHAMLLYDEEHDLALTLQRSLLPRRLPAVTELDLAVRYVPAGGRAEIGGDFYEVARFGDQLVVAVGDVGGHSLHAATIMAELRHATRAYLAEGHGPAAVVDRLNHLMAQLIPGEIATLCLLAIDLGTGRVRLANAGHPPPIVSGLAGVALVPDHSPLLGIRAKAATETELQLEPGDTVVLYTDGLVETRSETLDQSLDRLLRASTTVEADLEVFASRLLSEVGPSSGTDDIAMVAIRRRGPAAGPTVTAATGLFTVDLAALGRLRQVVSEHARICGLRGTAVEDIVLIANELATNVIRHGGGLGEMSLWCADGVVYCRVRDQGPGLSDPDRAGLAAVDLTASAGRGLWLIRQLADSLRIESGPGGTTVTAAVAGTAARV